MYQEILTDNEGLLYLLCPGQAAWFDLNHFTFERDRGAVRLRLGRRRKPYGRKLLIVTDVLDVKIQDEASAGAYELCDVKTTGSSVQLVGRAGPKINLAVGDLCRIILVDVKNGRVPEEAAVPLPKSRTHPNILIDLDGLLDMVHDRRFDLDQFEFDRRERKANLYLCEDSGERPYRRMEITDISDVSIHDTAKIQTYMFNDVELMPHSIRLVGIPGVEIVLTAGEQSKIYILHDAPAEKFAAFGGPHVEPIWVGKAIANLLRRLFLKKPPS